MKIYKEVPVPATTREVLQSTICALCKRQIPELKEFDACDIEISKRIGKNDPEGSCGTKVSFDVCEDCFDNKIIALFTSHCSVDEYTVEWGD